MGGKVNHNWCSSKAWIGCDQSRITIIYNRTPFMLFWIRKMLSKSKMTTYESCWPFTMKMVTLLFFVFFLLLFQKRNKHQHKTKSKQTVAILFLPSPNKINMNTFSSQNWRVLQNMTRFYTKWTVNIIHQYEHAPAWTRNKARIIRIMYATLTVQKRGTTLKNN